jgi:hypothetical protein
MCLTLPSSHTSASSTTPLLHTAPESAVIEDVGVVLAVVGSSVPPFEPSSLASIVAPFPAGHADTRRTASDSLAASTR